MIPAPALSDPVLAYMVRRTLFTLWLGMALVAVCLLILLGATLGSGTPRDWAMFISFGVLFVVWAIVALNSPWNAWAVRGRRLMETSPWRPVSAALVRRGSPLRAAVVDVEGRTLALRLGAGHEEVLCRTGRAWVVEGPRTVLLRVDGSRRCVLGRASERPETADVAPVDSDAFTPSTLALQSLRRGVAVLLLLPVIVWCCFFATQVLGGARPAAAALGSVFVVAVGLYFALRLLVPVWRASAQGPWTWVGVALNRYPRGGGEWENVTGTAVLPNGTRLAVKLCAATVDFDGTVRERGGVWVAGEPAVGKTLAVGFPDAPLSAAAVFKAAS